MKNKPNNPHYLSLRGVLQMQTELSIASRQWLITEPVRSAAHKLLAPEEAAALGVQYQRCADRYHDAMSAPAKTLYQKAREGARIMARARGRKCYGMVRAALTGEGWRSVAEFAAHVSDSTRGMSERAAIVQTGREMARAIKELHAKRERMVRAARATRLEPRFTLPLYACSGELECDGIDSHSPLVRRNNRHPGWDVGRDGGGQHEIRFRIAGGIPRAACRLVTRLGSHARNGGHIHLNCGGDDWVGERVFLVFRSHLSWMRWLTPYSRRHGRHTSVGATPSRFSDSQRVKFAAVSCSNWSRFGTVEVRLWATSRTPSDWHQRAALMQSLARMSETVPSTVDRITRADGRAKWEAYITWAHEHDQPGLTAALRMVRDVATSGSVDVVAIAECQALLGIYRATGLTVAGFRFRGAAAQAAAQIAPIAGETTGGEE